MIVKKAMTPGLGGVKLVQELERSHQCALQSPPRCFDHKQGVSSQDIGLQGPTLYSKHMSLPLHSVFKNTPRAGTTRSVVARGVFLKKGLLDCFIIGVAQQFPR